MAIQEGACQSGGNKPCAYLVGRYAYRYVSWDVTNPPNCSKADRQQCWRRLWASWGVLPKVLIGGVAGL